MKKFNFKTVSKQQLDNKKNQNMRNILDESYNLIYNKDKINNIPFLTLKDRQEPYRLRFVPNVAGPMHTQVLSGALEVGDTCYSMDYNRHWGIGPKKTSLVCARTFDKKAKCPACQYAVEASSEAEALPGNADAKGTNMSADDKAKKDAIHEAKSMASKRRSLYLVVDMDDPDKGLQILDTANWGFTTELNKELSKQGDEESDDEDDESFDNGGQSISIENCLMLAYDPADVPEKGDKQSVLDEKLKRRAKFAKILKVSVSKNDKGVGYDYTMTFIPIKKSRLNLIDYDWETKIAQSAPSFEDIIRQLSIDEISNIAYGETFDSPKKKHVIEDDDNEDILKNSSKVIETADDEDDEDDDKREDDETDDEDQIEDDESECPEGFAFGKQKPGNNDTCLDCDRLRDCRNAWKEMAND